MNEKNTSSPAVSSALLSVTNRLPARLVYRQPYSTIRALLSRAEAGEDVSPYLASRLASVLRTAVVRVPYYRELGLGIRPEEITSESAYEVLSRFPYLEKRDIMDAPESFVSDEYAIEDLTLVTSGGSTGQSVKLYRNAPLRSAEAAFVQHGWGKAGYVRSARMARIGYEGRRKEHEEPCSRSGDRLLVSPYHFNERWIGRIYEDMKSFEPRFIHAYPSCFEYLADYLAHSGLRLPGLSAIFLASERVTERHLDLADEVFEGVPVVFHYGMAERTNLAWGSRREDGIRYEFERAYGFSENYAASGFGHEIVGTSYWNEVMPLIRYRTQDYGEIRDGTALELEGREQEFLLTSTGERIPGICIALGDHIVDYVHGVQMVQNEAGRLEFRMQPRPEYDVGIGEQFLASQRAQWGDAFEFSLVVVDEIERTPSGKIRRYVVNVPT